MSRIMKIKERYRTLSIAAKAGIWFVICSVIQKSFSLITTPVFTRLLTKEEFGIYSVYLSWLQVFTIVCTFRLDFGVFNKGMTKYHNNKEDYTSSMQGITTLLTIIAFLIYLLFQKQINQITELSTVITLFLFLEMLFTPALNFWMIRQRYDFQYRGVVFVTVVMSAANFLTGLAAVVCLKDKGFARILSCVIVQACFGLIFYLVNLSKSKKIWKWEYIKFAIIFNLPLIPHYFSSYILDQSDRIMIQKMCGLESAALYSVAYNAGLITKIIVNSINNALIPWQYRKLEKGQYKGVARQMQSASIMMAFAFLIFIAFGPELIKVMASEKYYDAVYVIPPVAASMFFVFLYSVFCNIEFFYDANKAAMIISTIGAAVNILLNYYCIPRFGYAAAGYTTLFCYLLFAGMHYVYVNKVVKANIGSSLFSTSDLLPVSLIFLILASVISVFYGNWIIRYLFIWGLIVTGVIKRNYLINILKDIRDK